MKFIPKKAPGGLVQRYLDANPYSLSLKPAPSLPFLATKDNTTINPAILDSTYGSGRVALVAPHIQPIVMPPIQDVIQSIISKPSLPADATFAGPPAIQTTTPAKPATATTKPKAAAPVANKTTTAKPETTKTTTTASKTTAPAKSQSTSTTKPATKIVPKQNKSAEANKMKLSNEQVISIATTPHPDRYDLSKMLPADAERVMHVRNAMKTQAKPAAKPVIKPAAKSSAKPTQSDNKFSNRKTVSNQVVTATPRVNSPKNGTLLPTTEIVATPIKPKAQAKPAQQTKPTNTSVKPVLNTEALQRLALNDRVSDATLKQMYNEADFNRIMAVRNAARKAKK